MTEFPPSLSRVRTVPRSDRRAGHRERQVEREKKRKARLAAIEGAIRQLPLKPGAEADIRKMAGLFEQASYAAQNVDKAATTRRMEDELKALAKGLNKVVEHIDSLHPDTLRAWAAGADPAANGAALLLVVTEAEDWAQMSVDTLKRASRVGGRGRTENLTARSMRQTAAFVYERLTKRKANIAYDAYAGQERETPFVTFLEGIYEAYGVNVSAKSHARRRKPMAKK